MLRQFTFTADYRGGGAGAQGPDALLFLIQDPLTALRLIETLAQELRRTVDQDNPITVGFTGDIEADAGDVPGRETSHADKF